MCSYVIDEKGLLKLWENFDKDYNIVPILIKRDESILCKTVDSERLKRDKLRVTIEDAAYKAIIVNNGTLEEFQEQAIQTIQTLI